jgi:hypothetical protein
MKIPAKPLVGIIIMILFCSVVIAIDFNPMGDVNLKGRYVIKNGTTASFSGNITAANFVGNITGSVDWLSVLGRPTHLSNFTDNLGNRGYTHQSNFTDDTNYSEKNVNRSDFWNNLDVATDITAMGAFSSQNINAGGYNVTASYFIGDGSQLTGLTNISTASVNHSNSSDFWDDLNTIADAGIGNWSSDKASYATTAALSSVGNWTADKASYYTSAIVDSLGNWTADKASYATAAALSSVGNWTADKASYALNSRVTLVNATANSLGNWSADKASYMLKAGSTMSGALNTSFNGTTRNFANACIEVSNATGWFIVC